ncbi:MAG: hypothetical protein WDM81_02500 [Rhizomicrobium sp.]
MPPSTACTACTVPGASTKRKKSICATSAKLFEKSGEKNSRSRASTLAVGPPRSTIRFSEMFRIGSCSISLWSVPPTPAKPITPQAWFENAGLRQATTAPPAAARSKSAGRDASGVSGVTT